MPISENYKPGLVSVIIPLYNRAKFIEQTIKSVLDQDYENVELIVVDDGSSDGSLALVEKYANVGKLTLLRHPGGQNKGQSASINLGLDVALGEYIAVLDSDDLFAAGKLRKQVRYLEGHPEFGLVYGMGHAICAEGKYLYDILGPDHIETNERGAILMDCYFLLPQNSLVRRSVYREAGYFNESFRAAQDHDMLVRMAEVTRFAFMAELVFYYRRHGDSISAHSQERRWRNGFQILAQAKAREFYPAKVIRKRAAVLNFRMAEVFLRAGKPLHCAPYLVKAALLDPARTIRTLRSILIPPKFSPPVATDI